MKRRLVLPLILAACAPAASGSDFDAAYETITGEAIAADIAILASDGFEGRGPGGNGERLTINHIADAFREAGIGPANNGSYFQPFGLAHYQREGLGSFSITGPSGDVELAVRDDYVTYAGRPSAAIDLDLSRVVIGGFGIDAAEEGWHDYDGADLEGATVILFRGDPGTASNDPSRFGGSALSVHGLLGTKYDAISARGGAAAIVIHTDASAGYPWATMAAGGGGNEQYFLAESDDTHLDMVVHMSEPAARRLFAAAGIDFDATYGAATEPGFRAIETTLRASGSLRGVVEVTETNNVIGRIEGSEAPDECVIYTAHWDHMGTNPDAPEGDPIYNGALDNASGTAMLMAVARAFAEMDAPRRSVLFFATAAEERGLYGAEHFVANPLCEPANIAGVFNMDAHFPFADQWNAMVVPGLGTSELENYIGVAADRLGRTLIEDSNPQAGGFYRSDHWPFIKAGIPGIYAVGAPDEAQIAADDTILPQFANYMQNGYHHAADEYDAAVWRMGGIEGDARIYFEAGFTLAENDDWPEFSAGTPYRALRDGMRGE